MRKIFSIPITVFLGFVLGTVGNNITHSSYTISSGVQGFTYYSIGFPFVHYQMLGDAGVSNEFNIILNYIFWFGLVFLFYFIYNKYFKK